MHELDFVGGQVRRVRPKQEEFALAAGQEYFQIELRARQRQGLPGHADLARLLGDRVLGRMAQHDGRGLQVHGGAQDAVPDVIGGDHGQVNGLAVLFRQRQRLREQILLVVAEDLFGLQLDVRRKASRDSKRTCSTTTSRRSGLTRSSTAER